MPQMAESYLKFNYSLRPAKQVERKLLVEGLLKLSAAGYSIHDYTYLGFGSVYYADFLVFNRYLYVDEMICVEGSQPIFKRMDFNKPLGQIQLKLDSLAAVIPELSPDTRYLAWLDYDTPLTADVMADVHGVINRMAPGSILIVTVDAEARIKHEAPFEDKTGDEIRSILSGEISGVIDDYLDNEKPFTTAHYNNVDLPIQYSTALSAAIGDAVKARSDGTAFRQLFNFAYRDGAQMLSLGGIIDVPDKLDALEVSSFADWQFLNPELHPIQIAVPPLTPREKLLLDLWVTTPQHERGALPFELDDDYLQSFELFQRYYPQYFETLT